MNHQYLFVSNTDLQTERQQLRDEGKDARRLEAEFKRLARLDLTPGSKHQRAAENLLDRSLNLPTVPGFPYSEPSDLAGIRRARPKGPRELRLRLKETELFDRVHGAWLGRCAGCLLGKPYEGWRTPRLWGFLKDTGQFPLNRYFSARVSPQVQKRYRIDPNSPCSVERIQYMPEDDDTNYTVTGFAILKQHGRGFTPEDVATVWMYNLPILHTYTAERVAYRNLANLIPPPHSAAFRNPYREWIGAQIRADFFGYAALGRPELAAEFAWRDACISHVKNGIYGAIWVAAMLAAAPTTEDMAEIIRIGLSEIPLRSRLAEAIRDVLKWREEGAAYDEAVARLHRRWDENSAHHWCHTVSNAQIVALGLLWGEGDFEKAICRAVQPGFDTDCNGATVGSIMGMTLGAKALPRKWTAPLHGKLRTGFAGYELVRIVALAREGFELYMTIRA